MSQHLLRTESFIIRGSKEAGVARLGASRVHDQMAAVLRLLLTTQQPIPGVS